MSSFSNQEPNGGSYNNKQEGMGWSEAWTGCVRVLNPFRSSFPLRLLTMTLEELSHQGFVPCLLYSSFHPTHGATHEFWLHSGGLIWHCDGVSHKPCGQKGRGKSAGLTSETRHCLKYVSVWNTQVCLHTERTVGRQRHKRFIRSIFRASAVMFTSARWSRGLKGLSGSL